MPITQAFNNQLVVDGYMFTAFTAAVNVHNYSHFSLHYWITSGSPTGTFSFQASNEYDPHVQTYAPQVIGPANTQGTGLIGTYVTHWVNLDSSYNMTVTAGQSSTGLIDFVNKGFTWLNLVWTPSGGTTGIVQVRVQAKNS